MRRVLFASTVFDEVENGPGTYARYLWEAFLEDSEIEFHLVVPDSRLDHPRIHKSGKPAGSLQLYRQMCNKIIELHRNTGPFHLLHANSAHMLAGFKCADLPMLVQVNDYEVAEFLESPLKAIRAKGVKRSLSLLWRRYHEKKVLRQARLIITNSDFVRNKIVRAYRLQPEKCKTIYKAVDLSLFSNDKPSMQQAPASSIQDNKFKLICVGSNWEIKGLDLLLGALASLAPEGIPVELTVVGDGRHKKNDAIRKSFAELERSGVVRYLGRKERSDIATLLSEADVCVLPSRQEALGVSILESMAAGIPVIASNVGGIPEILEQGKNGVEVQAENVAEIAAAIKELYGSESLRNKYREAGWQRVKNFSKSRMVEQVRQTYLEMPECAK